MPKKIEVLMMKSEKRREETIPEADEQVGEYLG